MDLQEFKGLFEADPKKYPHVFEKRHGPILQKILDFWVTPIEADIYFDKLINLAANMQASPFANDAKFELVNIREAFKLWRASQRPRAPAGTLRDLHPSLIFDIVANLAPPSHDIIAAMKKAHSLAASNSPAAAQFFEANNLSPNQQDLDGTSSLMICAQRGCEMSAMALIRAGANPHMCDSLGNTALHWAVMQNKRRMTEMLLYFGANANAANASGTTPYSLSVIKEDSTIAQRLYEYGADIATQDTQGNTPLHKAVSAGSHDNVWLLLMAGSPFTARNRFGSTPMELAEKNQEMLKIFERHAISVKQSTM